MRKLPFTSLSERLRRMGAGLSRFAPVCAASCLWFLCAVLPSFVDLHGVYRICAAGVPAAEAALVAALCLRLWCERRGSAHLHGLPWLGCLAAYSAVFVWVLLRGRESHLVQTVVLSGLLMAGLAWAVWLLYGDANRDSLFADLCHRLLFVGALCTVVTLGLFTCALAVETLLAPISDGMMLVCFSLPWMLLCPVLFCAQLPACGESRPLPKALRLVLGRAALPLYLLLMGILYCYVGKILFTWKMPSGTMNWFASLALAGYLLFWLALRQDAARWVQTVLRWGWAGLLPILAVQLVGIGIRLHAYGLTAPRYAGLLMLLVGVYGLYLAARQLPPRRLFAAFAVVVLVGSLSPLNILDLPRWEQTHRAETILRRYDLWDGSRLLQADAPPTPQECNQLYESWHYLIGAKEALLWKPALARELEQHTADSLSAALGFALLPGAVPQPEQPPLDLYLTTSAPIPLQGYAQAWPVDLSAQIGPGRTVLTHTWQDGPTLTWDCAHWVDELRRSYTSEDGFLQTADRMLPLDENQVLFVTAVQLYGSEGTSLWVEGWLLVK